MSKVVYEDDDNEYQIGTYAGRDGRRGIQITSHKKIRIVELKSELNLQYIQVEIGD